MRCWTAGTSGRALSSAGERCLHTAEVTGSKPVAPTVKATSEARSRGAARRTPPVGNGLGNGFGVVCTATSCGAGTWRVHVYLGPDARTGKQRYLTRTARGTKRDVEKVRAGLVAQAVREVRRSGGRDLADVAERWLEHLAPDISPATASAYRSTCAIGSCLG